MRHQLTTAVAAFIVAITACGSSSQGPNNDTVVPSGPNAAGSPAGASEEPKAPAPSISCSSKDAVRSIADCMDSGKSPNACLEAAKVTPCDADEDGVDDSLEDAMLESYAPVFAFNKGDGSHTGGDSESAFPANANHYVAHSKLYWRVDGDDGTKKLIDDKPTLDGLRNATFTDAKGVVKRADSPALGQGTNFWLCLDHDKDGNYSDAAVVPSMEASRSLANGVDIFAVAHPTTKGSKTYVALQYMLIYPYNKFTFDDHEGDFEGGAVFVSLETGKVAAFYTDRHPTSDSVLLASLEGKDASPAKDPANESPRYNICDDVSATSASGGVRFWDFATNQHHPVIYVAGGGHASYAYPGATKIQGAGCLEATMIRDVHNGNGPKLVPFENAYANDWGNAADQKPIAGGVHIKNLGEANRLRETWSAFKGQWGCTLSQIPKSYPGPWDNERLCRHWLTNDWGAAPPFKKSSASSCK